MRRFIRSKVFLKITKQSRRNGVIGRSSWSRRMDDEDGGWLVLHLKDLWSCAMNEEYHETRP